MPKRTPRTGKPWSANCMQRRLPSGDQGRSADAVRPGARAPSRRDRRLLSLAQREIAATMGVDIVNVAEPWKSRANSRANAGSSSATPGDVTPGSARSAPHRATSSVGQPLAGLR